MSEISTSHGLKAYLPCMRFIHLMEPNIVSRCDEVPESYACFFVHDCMALRPLTLVSGLISMQPLNVVTMYSSLHVMVISMSQLLWIISCFQHIERRPATGVVICYSINVFDCPFSLNELCFLLFDLDFIICLFL